MPGRTFAIGDIHGCAAAFAALLDALAPTPDDTLILLGDYIDRGPDSKNTLNLILALKSALTVIALRGNHDLWMVAARDDADERRRWLSVGGVQTLGSYGPAPGRSGSLNDVPAEHWALLESGLADFHETDSHIFVHATIDPTVPLAEQAAVDLFWNTLTEPIRHPSGKTIICGHTAQKTGLVLDWGSTICIDTYAYGGGPLTALDVHSRQIWQVDMLGRITTAMLPVTI
jgi:serine/threonine protein phosphatase 1